MGACRRILLHGFLFAIQDSALAETGHQLTFCSWQMHSPVVESCSIVDSQGRTQSSDNSFYGIRASSTDQAFLMASVHPEVLWSVFCVISDGMWPLCFVAKSSKCMPPVQAYVDGSVFVLSDGAIESLHV